MPNNIAPSVSIDWSTGGWYVQVVRSDGVFYSHFKRFSSSQDAKPLFVTVLEAVNRKGLEALNMRYWRIGGNVFHTGGCLNPACDLLDGHEGFCEKL